MECPLCTADRFTEWAKFGMYEILRCNDCRVGITTPIPTEEERRKTNEDFYELENMVDVSTSRRRHFIKRYGKHIEIIKEYHSGGKLLNVGCNLGFFLKTAQDAGFNAIGVEPNEKCAGYGASRFGLTVYPDYLENLHFPDESFDIVTFFDVLEHVPHPRAFLAEVYRIIKKDGLLVVQSPNIDSLMSQVTKSGWAWLSPTDHLFHFHPEVLEKLLRTERFFPVRSATWEPLMDFCMNLFPDWRPESYLGNYL